MTDLIQGRVAGCDLGKATAKLVVGTIQPDGTLRIDAAETVVHEGRPMEAFASWYERLGIASCEALGATGLHADELIEPAVTGLPEDACLLAGLGLVPGLSGPFNVVSIGARGYSVLTRDARGRVQYVENDKCSSGTGETMVKIAGRFGLSIEQADRLATTATEAIPITARCSVFAKSEMTHFGNQGRSADALFRGYFGAVASYVTALLARARVEGPVVLVGGATRIGALVEAMGAAVGEELIVPDEATVIQAMGAALLAAEQCRAEALDPLPHDPTDLIVPTEHRFRVLPPASNFADRVTRLVAPPAPAGAERAPCVLGLDLGSTGSKLVLTSVETGEAVLDLYDRTRGNPVEAAQRLIAALLDRTAADVRAVGLTGSGREAAATVLRAVWPEAAARIVVINEIVAHATAAIRCDRDGDGDLSIVEIGGQDAKFVQVRGGQIVESDMNKACSAGTGSFLEEQAVFYGIHDIEEFTGLAREAKTPPDLGQMCTVFVAEAAAEAHNEGFGLSDLFGGFQYSVIHNYMNRVMGQRTFAQRIFFQGKPASGESLPWTLAAVTGREVIVPPNPGAMGAWGIGLCVLRDLDREALLAAHALDLRSALGARVVGRTEIQCRDRACGTLCTIEKTAVSVGERKHSILSGGACPKYEISTATKPKLPIDSPSAFDERAALLAPYLEDTSGRRTVGVALVGACHNHLPWLVTLLRELDIGVRVLRSDADSLPRGEARCYSFDACAPVKIAHGVVDADVDTILLPKVLSVGDRDGCGGRTCPMNQALPEMVESALRDRGRNMRVLRPIISFQEGYDGLLLLAQLLPLREELVVDEDRLLEAVRAAARAQRDYEAALAEIGESTLSYGREHGLPTVVVSGSLHVIHDRAVNAGIPGLLRENGVLALPVDCYPIPESTHPAPRIAWGDANRAVRAALDCRVRGDAYPLFLSSFGCGPASFMEQVFGMLMEGYPHTALESDGHGGTAGYVTRVQAFLHTVRKHDRAPSPAPPDRMALLNQLEKKPYEDLEGSRFVVLSMADKLSPVLAAVYRSYGLDTVASGPTSPDTLALGRRDCSGKECLPYQLIWGTFREHLERDQSGKPAVLMQVTGQGRCRNCMFSLKDEISLRRLGRSEDVSLRHWSAGADLGWRFMVRLSSALVVWDVLYQLTAYYRPVERFAGEVDALYARFADELTELAARPMRGSDAARNGASTVSGLGSALRGLIGMAKGGSDLRGLLDRVAVAFEEVARRSPAKPGLRTVFLSGDIYVRIDEFASDSLIRRLNERGIRVIVEPVSVLAEYMLYEGIAEILDVPTDLLENEILKRGNRRVRKAFYEQVRQRHSWLPLSELPKIVRESRKVLDRHPQGEAPVTVGSVMHHWDEGICDGVVVVSPWGCGPALISESLLRHQRHIPLLFVYSDGSPMDQRRLNAFAFRLRRLPPRAPEPTAVPRGRPQLRLVPS